MNGERKLSKDVRSLAIPLNFTLNCTILTVNTTGHLPTRTDGMSRSLCMHLTHLGPTVPYLCLCYIFTAKYHPVPGQAERAQQLFTMGKDPQGLGQRHFHHLPLCHSFLLLAVKSSCKITPLSPTCSHSHLATRIHVGGKNTWH